ncbi:alpha/beta fold hydrolase [Microbulbifer yueqingensis]|uniref:Pimeloyl-ACP methyl ester carboxylesterase n=1 Tax=Microbulbifer yueqingensis TaxID=658219 RepID=A0A1G9DNI1_9GAMM|nr:alpha/beta hydrolase [Microbulbifer yueqingensis]SDK65345.1 Pimeloyl-ACP methyl ester carboxylesterase [Microbulbifer yueqingensis]
MMSLQEWRNGASIFAHGDFPVFTRVGGNPAGPALLLLHGFPTSSWDWNRVWDALAANFSLYTLDMLGFGDSPKPRNFPYRIEDQATLVESWLLHLGVGEFHILAHDYGDTVAQELLARYRQRQDASGDKGVGLRVASVCLLNGGLFPEAHRPALIQRLLSSPVGPLVGRIGNRKRLAANMARIFGPQTQPCEEEIDNFWKLLCNRDGRRILHRLVRYMSERRRHRKRWVGALCETEVPLKLIVGLFDPVSGRHMAARYRELVPQADITGLEGIGHYPQLEAPQAVLDALRGFMLRHGLAKYPAQVLAGA